MEVVREVLFGGLEEVDFLVEVVDDFLEGVFQL